MIILSYGFKLPQTPDKGSLFFPALEFNIQRLNDHSHNGSDSAKISSTGVNVVKANILAASWAAVAGQPGTFRQTVTMPVGMLFDDYELSFRLAASGDPVMLTVEKVTASTYRVYINDSTQSLVAFYSS